MFDYSRKPVKWQVGNFSNKSQSKTWNNTQRTILAINLFGIVKEKNGDNNVFYEGWDPQKRGEKIMKEFFVKEL